MIQTAIEFEEAEMLIIKSYNHHLPNAHSFWGKDCVNGTRSVIKKHYLVQQEYRCCYCQRPILSGHGRMWDVEHILPASKYPQFLFEPYNLAVSCLDCNQAKSDKNVLFGSCSTAYPSASNRFKIIHPHYDNFDEHIKLKKDIFYVPKTEKGEETIYTCRLMRYCYKFVGWDEELADSPVLSDKFDEIMDATSEKEVEEKMSEIFAVVNL